MSLQTSHALTGHLPALDGLRAVACLMVFGVHFGQISKISGSVGNFDIARFLANGNTGVALFFSLSGFLLSAPFWSAFQSGSTSPRFGRYLLRRALRIVPAYFACLTLLIVLNKFWHEADWQRATLLHYLMIFNYDAKTIFAINPPFWTLAVEAQFYILLPLLFVFGRAVRPKAFMLLTIALAALAYAAHYGMSQLAAASHPLTSVGKELSPVITYSLLAHLPHFLLGIASCWIFLQLSQRQPSVHGSISSELLVWTCAGLILVILATPLDERLQIPYGRYNLPFIPIMLCAIIVFAPITSVARALLESAAMRGIGAISFGFYIYHLPIQHFTARYMRYVGLNAEKDWLLFGLTSLGLSLMVATISYLILERPILALVKGSASEVFKMTSPELAQDSLPHSPKAPLGSSH